MSDAKVRGLGPKGPEVNAANPPGPKLPNAWTRQQVVAARAHEARGIDDVPARETGAPEDDDAPLLDDVPDWGSDESDDEREESDDRDHRPAYSAWTRLSIWPTDRGFEYAVSIPRARQSSLIVSAAYSRHNWAILAETLIARQPSALRATTLREAYLALVAIPMKHLERSAGQGSRDRDVVVEIEAGDVPLAFFSSAPGTPGLLANLVDVARFAAEHPELERLSVQTVSQAVPRPVIAPDSLRKTHAGALIALRDNPDVLRRHRALWPFTSPDRLYDDLGFSTASRRSHPVAMLALTDCIFTEAELCRAAWPDGGQQ